MAIRWAVQNGNFSSTSTWNDGVTLGIPTSADDIWANGFVVNVDTNITVISLNNVARARDVATPAMTSNNSPSPFVVAASSQSGGAEWRAFDRNYTSASNFWQASGGVPQWISIDFGSGNNVIIDAYTIFGTGSATQNPRNWTLEGSNNNVNWVTAHTVTLATQIPAGSSYSSGSIGNTTGYRYYRINVSATGGGSPAITEIELYQQFTAAIAAGGSFNFNTSGVTTNITSLTTPLGLGTTNIIQITASAGTVNINFSAIITNNLSVASNVISHTGNVNFILSGPEFRGGGIGTTSCITKSSSGNISISGGLRAGSNGNSDALINQAGTVNVVGNVNGGSNPSAVAIRNTGGNVTVTGNVNGGSAGPAITTTVGTLTVTGLVNGGSSGLGIVMTNPTVNVIGNITAGSQQAINASSASNTLNVTGNITASATANAIAGNGMVVRLAGNMFNSSTYNAIYAPFVFIDDTTTTQWRIFDTGGQEKSLYSADFTPNAPSENKVRFGVTYGFGGGLTGTAIIPSPANIRKGVPTDNTVGTGELTAEDFLNAISASTNPIAIRLKNIATVQSTGDQVASYNI